MNLFASTVWATTIREKDFARIVDWFTYCFFATGCFGILAVGAAAYVDGNGNRSLGIRVFAFSLLLAGACTLCGWLLGLLFGIPRSLSRPVSAPAPPASGGTPAAPSASPPAATSKVNTNLEDISDWLTKTIVGVGLTQFYQAPKFLGDLARDANQYGFGWNAHGQLLTLGLIFYFAPGGFWLGYVGTRTIVTLLFDFIDRRLSEDQLSQAAKLDITEAGIRTANPAQQSIDATLLTMSIKDLTTTTQTMAWAGAQARAGNLDLARFALEGEMLKEPQNNDLKQQLATVYSALRLFDKAASLLDGTPDTPTKMLSALYEPPPGGFQKAITIGQNLIKDPKFANNADLHVWLACAYAQQYGDVRSQDAAAPNLAAIKQNVLQEIKAAIALQPSARATLFRFWRPSKDEIDNDLAVFDKDDPELGALLSL